MKNWLFSLFKKVFAKELSRFEKAIRNELTETMRKSEAESRRCIETIEANMLVSHPVIYFSNEYDNPTVGFVKSVVLVTQAQCPMLLVHDYIRNEEVVVHHRWPSLQMFSEQIFNGMCGVDRNVIIAFLYGRYRDSSNPSTEFRKKPQPGYLTLPQLIGRLQQNGFYEKLREYQASVKTLKQTHLQDH